MMLPSFMSFNVVSLCFSWQQLVVFQDNYGCIPVFDGTHFNGHQSPVDHQVTIAYVTISRRPRHMSRTDAGELSNFQIHPALFSSCNCIHVPTGFVASVLEDSGNEQSGPMTIRGNHWSPQIPCQIAASHAIILARCILIPWYPMGTINLQ